MKRLISKKILRLNQATLQGMADGNNTSILKNFTEESIKILGADFGFAWGKLYDSEDYKLIYKSLSTPYNPTIPIEKQKSHLASQRKNSLFDSNVRRENYEPDISRYLKSYIIIPIRHIDHVYGSIVLCYKQEHNFTGEELALAETIGNVTAQAITTNWLVEKEKKALALAEKQKETEILLAQEKLKMEFIANATHELRTPLAIIKGNVDLAALQPKTTKKSLEAIDHEIKDLSGILSDLTLIISEKNELKNRIARDRVNIKLLIGGIVKRCKVLAHKKNISITTKKIPNVTILGDKLYLEKMLTNLVRNSVIYGNKNGHTEISAKESKKFITISVADNGIGISKEDSPHVFERFYKADKSHSGKGTGLGLAIVKWIAEVHGGSVSVKNLKNKGTIFSVSLPVRCMWVRCPDGQPL